MVNEIESLQLAQATQIEKNNKNLDNFECCELGNTIKK